MRILFVAMADSIHTARWIDQLAEQGWDIHLFPSIDTGISIGSLRDVTIHHSFHSRRPKGSRPLRVRGIPMFSPTAAALAISAVRREWPEYHARRLARLIERLKPDIVHSMEIQAAGYLTHAARQQCRRLFPTWIVTNWGSDIYLFGRLAEHADRIRAVLAACDYYSCETERDVGLARDMGFKGQVLPVLPNTGGFDLVRTASLRQPGPPSSRKLLLVKGYQHWAGRALVAIRAIALCAEQLQGFRVAVYSAGDDVRMAAELTARSAGIPIDCLPKCSHEEMLSWYGKARIYIGLSISDAIPTSLLEAMVMGAFPIQSDTGAADEWITNGSSGLIVPPEDPELVAAAIRRAVSDDALVDRAAEMNAQAARERLDEKAIRPQVIAMYERVAAGGRGAVRP